MTTLLVPAHRVAYNKAAGAEARERSLRSYVLGHYKAARSDAGGSGKPVALRGPDSYAVILAVFHNAGYDQTVTLAQVFWLKDPAGKPLRLYAVAEKELGIASDFADFGTDIAKLRKRLRSRGAVVEDTFPPYGALFRPFRHPERAGVGAVPPDRVDEVGGQPDRLRAQSHAGALRRGAAPRRSDRAFR
jgi:uncharacterized protein YPO0396